MPLVAALQEQKRAQLGEQMLAGSEWQDEDLVFAQRNGRPIDKMADNDLLLSANVHPRVAVELLRHSQMRTTTDIYSHVMPPLAREAADRMGAATADGKQATATTEVVDSGRDEEGPVQMGGAEGTRTPDPHTARPT